MSLQFESFIENDCFKKSLEDDYKRITGNLSVENILGREIDEDEATELVCEDEKNLLVIDNQFFYNIENQLEENVYMERFEVFDEMYEHIRNALIKALAKRNQKHSKKTVINVLNSNLNSFTSLSLNVKENIESSEMFKLINNELKIKIEEITRVNEENDKLEVYEREQNSVTYVQKELSRNIRCLWEENVSLISKLNRMKALLNNNEEIINAVHISKVMYPLKTIIFNKHNERNAIIEFLEMLSEFINNIDVWSGREIGRSLHGLQNFTCDEVSQNIIESFSKCITNASIYSWTSEDVSNAIYGLKKLGDERIDCDLLKKFPEIISNVEVSEWKAIEIVDIIYSLKCLSDKSGARELLLEISYIIPKISESSWNVILLGKAFLGLQGLSEKSVPEELLVSLTDIISQINISKWNTETVTNILFSLQGINDKIIPPIFYSEMLKIIQVIPASQWGVLEIGNALYGLNNKPLSHDCVSVLINVLPQLLNIGVGHTVQSLFALKRGFSVHNKKMPQCFEDQYERDLKEELKVAYKNETIAADFLKQFFHVEISKVIDGFETDIFIPVLNWIIEIDGTAHHIKKGKDLVRDKYFKQNGYAIKRIDTTHPTWEKNFESFIECIYDDLLWVPMQLAA